MIRRSAALLLLAGCSVAPVASEPGAGDTTMEDGGVGMTGAPSDTSDDPSTATTDADATSDSSPSSSDDTDVSDSGQSDGGTFSRCNVFAQNCPLGEKCVAWADDGGTFVNAARCVPVVDDPATIGEPCSVQGFPTSGLDDCDIGAACYYVDEQTLTGVCVAQCTGEEANPLCEVDTVCTICADCSLLLCLPTCNPLTQDCPADQACHLFAQHLVCALDAATPDAGAGTPCDTVGACPLGTECLWPEAVWSCTGVGCCSAWCSLDDPDPPCLEGQSCVSWYPVGEAPAGYELLGICTVPA